MNEPNLRELIEKQPIGGLEPKPIISPNDGDTGFFNPIQRPQDRGGYQPGQPKLIGTNPITPIDQMQQDKDLYMDQINKEYRAGIMQPGTPLPNQDEINSEYEARKQSLIGSEVQRKLKPNTGTTDEWGQVWDGGMHPAVIGNQFTAPDGTYVHQPYPGSPYIAIDANKNRIDPRPYIKPGYDTNYDKGYGDERLKRIGGDFPKGPTQPWQPPAPETMPTQPGTVDYERGGKNGDWFWKDGRWNINYRYYPMQESMPSQPKTRSIYDVMNPNVPTDINFNQDLQGYLSKGQMTKNYAVQPTQQPQSEGYMPQSGIFQELKKYLEMMGGQK